LPSVFLVPRVAKSLLGGEEEQPRSYVNYLKGLGRYTIEKRFGHRKLLAGASERLLRPSRRYREWHG